MRDSFVAAEAGIGHDSLVPTVLACGGTAVGRCGGGGAWRRGGIVLVSVDGWAGAETGAIAGKVPTAATA